MLIKNKNIKKGKMSDKNFKSLLNISLWVEVSFVREYSRHDQVKALGLYQDVDNKQSLISLKHHSIPSCAMRGMDAVPPGIRKSGSKTSLNAILCYERHGHYTTRDRKVSISFMCGHLQ